MQPHDPLPVGRRVRLTRNFVVEAGHTTYQPGDEIGVDDEDRYTIHTLGPRLPNPVLPKDTLGTVTEFPLRAEDLPPHLVPLLLPDISKTCTVKWDFDNPFLSEYVDVPWEFIEFAPE